MIRIAFAALLVAGCASNTQLVPDRYFTTYQAMLSNQTWRAIEASPYAKTVPGPVKIAYSDCSAAYVMTGFTAAEKERLDAYASHKITMTAGEAADLDRAARERLGGEITYANLDRLAAVCPDQVPAFRQYFKP